MAASAWFLTGKFPPGLYPAKRGALYAAAGAWTGALPPAAPERRGWSLMRQENELRMGQNPLKGIFLAVMASAMWGIMGIFVRGLSSVGYSSYDISFLRCLLAGIGFFLFKAATDPGSLKIDGKGLLVCFYYGLAAYAVGFVAYGIALERIPVAVATVLMFLSPVWVVVLGAVFFKEKLRAQTAAVILICIIGASLVANVFGTAGGQLDSIGIAAGLVNGFSVALQLMIPRLFLKTYRRDTMLVYGFFGAAIGLSFLTDFHKIAQSIHGPHMPMVLIHALCLGFLCTMVANVSFVNAAAYISTTVCSILSSLEVVVGGIVGVLAFQERMSLLQVIGAVIIVGGALLPAVLAGRQANAAPPAAGSAPK